MLLLKILELHSFQMTQWQINQTTSKQARMFYFLAQGEQRKA